MNRRRTKAVVVTLLLACLCFEVAVSDELNPAYLQITQSTADEWQVYWKVSHPSRLSHQPALLFSDTCQRRGDPQLRFDNGRRIEQFSLHCAESLSSLMVGVPSLISTSTDVLVRVLPLNTAPQYDRLLVKQPQVTFELVEQRSSNVFTQYTYIGFEHIVFGWDHLLFVIGMVLLISKTSRLFWAITAFTLAHSVTLVASTLQLLSLSQSFVEAMIALSIVVLAREAIFAQEDTLTKRLPWLVALAFGLLHGFGFAGALAEIGLPNDAIPMALFSFNLGVEIGQILVVIVFLIILRLLRAISNAIETRFRLVSAYFSGIIASVWLLQRVLA